MNTAFASYPRLGGTDFESSIGNAQRFKANEIYSFSAGIDLSMTFTVTGFAESIQQIVEKKATDLSPPLFRRVMALSRLDENWDGEGAKAVKPYILADVVETLKRFTQQSENYQEPFLAPTFEGFLQMEWHNKKRSLDIEAVNQGWFLVGTMIDRDGKRHYFEAECERSDFEKLQQFYEWYIGDELLWPSP